MGKTRRFGIFFSLPFLLCGCAFNLGKFEKADSYATYYASFGAVRALYDGGSETYDIKNSLFNATTVNSMAWKEGDPVVTEHEYLYFILPIAAELTISEIAMYIRSPERGGVSLSLFHYPSGVVAPSKIKYRSSPDEEDVLDEHGDPTGEKVPIVYDDPSATSSLATLDFVVSANTWKDFGFHSFNQPGFDDHRLHVNDGDELYLRVENNSGFHRDDMKALRCTFINLLIRAEE